MAKGSNARRIGVVALLLIGGAALLLLINGSAGKSDAASTLSLKGTWSGARERIASTDGYRHGRATLRVSQQRGLTFKGTLTRFNPGGNETEPLVGAFTPGGDLGAGADAEGTYTFELVDSSTLDFCYTESGEGYRTTCARLKKQ